MVVLRSLAYTANLVQPTRICIFDDKVILLTERTYTPEYKGNRKLKRNKLEFIWSADEFSINGSTNERLVDYFKAAATSIRYDPR
jgi:hypothetical protein